MQNVIPFPVQVRRSDVVAKPATSSCAETQSSIEVLVAAYDKLLALGTRMAYLLQMDVDAIVSRSSPLNATEAEVNVELAHFQAMVLRLSHQLAVLDASMPQLREKLHAS